MNNILKQVKTLVNKANQSCAKEQYKTATEVLNLCDALQQYYIELQERANITLQKEFDEVAASKVEAWKASGITINSKTTADIFRIEGLFCLEGLNFCLLIDYDEDEVGIEYSLAYDCQYGKSNKIINKLSSSQMSIYLGLINQFFEKFQEISKTIYLEEHDGDEPTYFWGIIDDGKSLASSIAAVIDTISLLITEHEG